MTILIAILIIIIITRIYTRSPFIRARRKDFPKGIPLITDFLITDFPYN